MGENPDVPTSATGFATAVYDSLADTLTVNMTYSGLMDNASDSHIHCCATGTTSAGVAVGFTGSGGFVTGSTSGTYGHVFNLADPAIYNTTFRNNNGGTAAGAKATLLSAFSTADPSDPTTSRAYFNIHSPFSASGEIRGDIFLVPEPTALLLACCGWGGLLLRRRR